MRGNRSIVISLTRDDVLGPAINLKNCKALVELERLPGLRSVKQSVKGLVSLALDNRSREEEGRTVQDVSLHRLFLGNPGTGKTSVAKVYGALLRELGLLSKGNVEVVGASKLTGSYVGSTAAIVNALLDSNKGCVLVIDEAYSLSQSIYGKEALDTLVERVQGTPGEDFAVIMCGYGDEMEAMLRNCNSGLARRFRMEDALRFEDYDDAVLVEIMQKMASDRGLKMKSSVAVAAVETVLSKERSKKNFGNAGAVKNLIEKGIMSMSRRRDNATSRWLDDELIVSDFFDSVVPGAAKAALSRMVNADHFLAHIDSLEKRIRAQKKRRGLVNSHEFLKNYRFTGPPGTGKTTVARAFGEVFHSLGLLADSRVVEVKGQELMAGYVGQTAPIVKAKLDEARGGVLFIDEAYALAHGPGTQDILGGGTANAFAKDALEALLANLTDPAYQGKMLVIIAGYDKHIEAVMRSNPGMARRFTELLEFPPWSPESCVQLVQKVLHDEGLNVSADMSPLLLEGFQKLMLREGWGNAGDAMTVASKLLRSGRAMRRVLMTKNRLMQILLCLTLYRHLRTCFCSVLAPSKNH